MFKYFCPDYKVKSIFDISAKWLRRNGYMKVVVDIDNTLLPRDKNIVGPRAMTWIRQMRQQGINVALITNNSGKRIDTIVRQTGCGAVMRASKPLPFAFKKIVKGMGGGKVLFVGDQIMTDVLGAKVSGMPIVLVDSLGGREHFITRGTRKVERLVKEHLVSSGRMPKERTL
ncbi:MAG: YqeG family HAD IIIA-type phosphatase [Phascolarctobacterium sp.]|nr:YqeG family HAD IIIA-type phosphatase [Phascolarctobacterium sp.]